MWQSKTGTSYKGNKWKTVFKMVAINTTIPLIAFNTNGLNMPIKRQIIRVDQKTRPCYMLFTRNPLKIYRNI